MILMIAKILAWFAAILFSLAYIGKTVNQEGVETGQMLMHAASITALIALYGMV